MAKSNYRDAYDAFYYAMLDQRPKPKNPYNNQLESINLNKELVTEVRQDYDGSMTVTLEGHTSDFCIIDEVSSLCKGPSKKEIYIRNKELIKRVIFNEPYTIVIWVSGEKTIVKAQDGEPYDKEKGLAMCFAKYFLGNTCRYFDFFKEVCGEEEEKAETIDIVRCKACKYWSLEKEYKRLNGEQYTTGYCCLEDKYSDSNWFCADGERKNSNE